MPIETPAPTLSFDVRLDEVSRHIVLDFPHPTEASRVKISLPPDMVRSLIPLLNKGLERLGEPHV